MALTATPEELARSTEEAIADSLTELGAIETAAEDVDTGREANDTEPYEGKDPTP